MVEDQIRFVIGQVSIDAVTVQVESWYGQFPVTRRNQELADQLRYGQGWPNLC